LAPVGFVMLPVDRLSDVGDGIRPGPSLWLVAAAAKDSDRQRLHDGERRDCLTARRSGAEAFPEGASNRRRRSLVATAGPLTVTGAPDDAGERQGERARRVEAGVLGLPRLRVTGGCRRLGLHVSSRDSRTEPRYSDPQSAKSSSRDPKQRLNWQLVFRASCLLGGVPNVKQSDANAAASAPVNEESKPGVILASSGAAAV
jgi:hypothetical protein